MLGQTLVTKQISHVAPHAVTHTPHAVPCSNMVSPSNTQALQLAKQMLGQTLVTKQTDSVLHMLRLTHHLLCPAVKHTGTGAGKADTGSSSSHKAD
jgi:hypothetical protein